MANSDHLAHLCTSVREWNDWRDAAPDLQPDLSGADLSLARLPLANLGRADLRDANLLSADLRKAKLSGAILAGADLSEADLEGADLRNANLHGAHLSGAKLAEANLAGADLRNASLLGTDLRRADMTGADLSGADLRKAKLVSAVLDGSSLDGAILHGAIFDSGTAATLYLTGALESGPEGVPRAPRRRRRQRPHQRTGRNHDAEDASRLWGRLATSLAFASRGRSGPPSRDPVLLGASAPSTVRPGRQFTARFVAYILGAEVQVKRILSSLSPRSALHLALQECLWKPGTEVTVELAAQHLKIAEPRRTFVWSGRWNLVDFDVNVPANAPEETTVLKYGISIAGARVALLRLDLDVDRAAPLKGTPPKIDRGEPARSAFASYASEDRARVLDRVAALRISAGMDVFQDCLSLHPGEEWKPRLEREIALRDLFLLFWSRHARTSPWVEWEWRTALSAKYADALELHPLEPVKRAPPPDELSHLHFGDPLMTLREYELQPD
jgi:hypothetical protein